MSAARLPELEAQARIASPVGWLTLAATARGLAGLWFDDQTHHPGLLSAPLDPEQRHVARASAALARYWQSDRSALNALAIDLLGTEFQRTVWAALRAIPAGSTTTYANIAAAIGNPLAVRAVGAAVGRNPISIIVPCHRVLGHNGAPTGYAGGLQHKHTLLQLEGILNQQSIFA